jgi:2-oxo-4-hydroxy-4-carboxy-5-ureidoimidazoline decarboxylase
VKLDKLSDADAAQALRACCGSERWVDKMLAARPFGSASRAQEEAERDWATLGRDDWMEAFSHHPRIGERKAAVAQDAMAKSWSSQEQSRMADADGSTKRRIAELNAKYEEKFGYIYIVCATGKSPAELLSLLEHRLSNDHASEILVAAEEQRKIMHLRLNKLLETT